MKTSREILNDAISFLKVPNVFHAANAKTLWRILSMMLTEPESIDAVSIKISTNPARNGGTINFDLILLLQWSLLPNCSIPGTLLSV